MATHAVSKTVTLSGSFTTGPSGGLLPAAPTIRIQGEYFEPSQLYSAVLTVSVLDFPLPNDFTPAG